MGRLSRTTTTSTYAPNMSIEDDNVHIRQGSRLTPSVGTRLVPYFPFFVHIVIGRVCLDIKPYEGRIPASVDVLEVRNQTPIIGHENILQ